jgi:hypothetical protein
VGSKVEVHDPTRPTLWSGDGDVSIDASVECAGHLQSEIRVFKRLAVVQRQGGDDEWVAEMVGSYTCWADVKHV